MATDFDDLAKQLLERVGLTDSAKDPDNRYVLEITDPRRKTHMMLMQEGTNEGCLEIFTTIADGGFQQEFLEIGLEQNLATFRRKGNIFAIDRETECVILCGRYDPYDTDSGDFSTWLEEYLAEMELYHEIADKLTHPVMDEEEASTANLFSDNIPLVKV